MWLTHCSWPLTHVGPSDRFRSFLLPPTRRRDSTHFQLAPTDMNISDILLIDRFWHLTGSLSSALTCFYSKTNFFFFSFLWATGYLDAVSYFHQQMAVCTTRECDCLYLGWCYQGKVSIEKMITNFTWNFRAFKADSFVIDHLLDHCIYLDQFCLLLKGRKGTLLCPFPIFKAAECCNLFKTVIPKI